jgi:hypothetical protein
MLMRVENLYGLSFIKYDVNQIHIQKPRGHIVGYYFFFKFKVYNMKWTILIDY